MNTSGATFGHDQDDHPGSRAQGRRVRARGRRDSGARVSRGGVAKVLHGVASGVRPRDPGGGDNAGDSHVRVASPRRPSISPSDSGGWKSSLILGFGFCCFPSGNTPLGDSSYSPSGNIPLGHSPTGVVFSGL